MNSRQFLTVLPKTHFDLSDKDLDRLAMQLLGIEDEKPPSLGREMLQILETSFRVALSSNFYGVGITKRQRVLAAMPELRALLKNILMVNSALLLPSLKVLPENDASLQAFSCIDGTFHTGIVYSSHPAAPAHFLRFANFHDYLLDEKRAEFVRLASALGAKSIQLIESERAGRTAGSGIELGESTSHAKVRASVEGRSSATIDFAISVTADEPPVRAPSVPSELRWLSLEPYWKAMAEMRMNDWVTNYNVWFAYTRDFGVAADAAATFTGIGLKLGGSFESMKAVRQHYAVEFWPRTSYKTT